jgi:hypothetical protein
MLPQDSNIAMMTLPALREQYRHHALTIRNVCTDTVKARLISLDRLYELYCKHLDDLSRSEK